MKTLDFYVFPKVSSFQKPASPGPGACQPLQGALFTEAFRSRSGALPGALKTQPFVRSPLRSLVRRLYQETCIQKALYKRLIIKDAYKAPYKVFQLPYKRLLIKDPLHSSEGRRERSFVRSLYKETFKSLTFYKDGCIRSWVLERKPYSLPQPKIVHPPNPCRATQTHAPAASGPSEASP